MQITLFKIFNIPIRIHWTFGLLLLYFFIVLFPKDISEVMFTTYMVSLLSLLVVAHELSHSLVARYFNYSVNSITLFGLGGVADISGFTKPEPKEELLIAAAGPYFNLTMAAIGFLPYVFFRNEYLATFIAINFILFAFNLIPVFPLDGGRVLRGILGIFFGYVKATEVVTTLGMIFSVVLMFYSIFSGNPIIAIIFIMSFFASLIEKYRLQGKIK